MGIVKKIVLGLVAVIALLAVGGFFLPADQRVEREVVIEASSERVYDVVRDFDQFNSWSPWFDLDPDARYEQSGTAGTVGSSHAWVSEKPEVGSGRQTITSLTPYSNVSINLEFDGQPPARTEFRLAETGDATRVVWTFETNLGANPLMRYFGLVIDKFVGRDYEKGLSQLKVYIESGAST
ncbi:MAG: SRPBCC family protein [Pseudomonadota bacterium]